MGTTTTGKTVGAVSRADGIEDLEKILERARKALGNTSALLDLETHKLFGAGIDPEEIGRYDKLQALIRQADKILAQITDIEKRVGSERLGERNALDLEDARAEIMRRLACLAADQKADGLSG